MISTAKRREIKREAKKNLKRNYILNIAVMFVVLILINGGYQFYSGRLANIKRVKEEKSVISILGDDSSGISTVSGEVSALNQLDIIVSGIRGTYSYINGQDKALNYSDILGEFLGNIFNMNSIKDPSKIQTKSEKYSAGFASVFVNSILGSQSFVFGFMNGINQLVFNGKIGSSIIIFIFVVISFLSFVYIKNVIAVGKNRYFLEQRRYSGTRAKEILFTYKNKRLINVSHVMFIRYIRQILWDLTIIGGIIKCYEYRMIPYILAENPKIKTKDAFELSKKLMKNEKWNVFVLDVTFFPWFVLSFLSFNIVGLFFANSYFECVNAELYMFLRKKVKKQLPEHLRELLNDDALDIKYVVQEEHPSGEEVLDIKVPHVENLKRDYRRKYSFLSIVELFFTYSLVGWVWEFIFYLAMTGQFVNRGTMHGPWLPIYGCGGLLIMVFLRPLREKPGWLFVGAMTLCGSLEYFASWILEVLFDTKWWDYAGYFMNLNGRICLEGVLLFGFAGFAFTYVISPWLDDQYIKMSTKYRKVLCTVLLLLFVADLIWSIISPNAGSGVTGGFV